MNWLAVLPPSETKCLGGSPEPLGLDKLAFPQLHEHRLQLVNALTQLPVDEQMARLRFTDAQRDWALDNQRLLTAPTIRSLERYTGVVFRAIDVSTFDVAGVEKSLWDAASRHLAIGSALWGLTLATDLIPRYRLSANHRLLDAPGKRRWQPALDAALTGFDGPVLDLRSHAYAAMGGHSANVIRVDVVAADSGKPLNHWNKHAKGVFARQLLEQTARGEPFDPSAAARTGDQQWRQIDDTTAQLAVAAPTQVESARRLAALGGTYP